MGDKLGKSVEHGYGYLSRIVRKLEIKDIPPENIPFIDRFTSAAEHIDSELELRGLPIAYKSILLMGNDRWVYHDKEKTEEEWDLWRNEHGIKIQLGWVYIQQREQLYSENWVLAELSFKNYNALRNLKIGDANIIADSFYEIGTLQAKYFDNLRYGPDVEKHKNLGKKDQNPETLEICSLMEKYYKETQNYNAAADLVLKRHSGLGGNVGAITRKFRRYRESMIAKKVRTQG